MTIPFLSLLAKPSRIWGHGWWDESWIRGLQAWNVRTCRGEWTHPTSLAYMYDKKDRALGAQLTVTCCSHFSWVAWFAFTAQLTVTCCSHFSWVAWFAFTAQLTDTCYSHFSWVACPVSLWSTSMHSTQSYSGDCCLEKTTLGFFRFDWCLLLLQNKTQTDR